MKFCVFFCILVAASPVFINNVIAQNSSRIVVISGTVLDPSGASAPDSAVTLKQGNSRIVSKTTTDISGGFRFEGISLGNYSIEVQHKGFEVSTCRIKISTTPPSPLTIKLALARLVSEVSITAGELEQVSTAVAENRDAATADQDTLTKLPVFDRIMLGRCRCFSIAEQSAPAALN
jgi:protocatechuate 3,4-dioxygenase beta subunit